MALSQEQINALLEGTGTYDNAALDEHERAFLIGFAQMAMTSASTAVSQALGQPVSLLYPELEVVQAGDLQHEFQGEHVLVRSGYVLGDPYPCLFVLKNHDAAVLFDILMGNDGRHPDPQMGELQISAIGEVMNQLMGAAATGLSKEFKQKIAMIPPESSQWSASTALPAAYQGKLLQIRYQLLLEGVLDSEFYELHPFESMHQLYLQLTRSQEVSSTPPVSAPSGGPLATSNVTSSSNATPTVRPVEFGALQPVPPTTGALGAANLDRILDIPLRLTVELGSTRLKVKNVVDLTKGSIVELDKLAGEAVDLLVNGRLMAKGEVVVVNENFGVRITEILGTADRLHNLSGSNS